jgi:hypothetical protein
MKTIKFLILSTSLIICTFFAQAQNYSRDFNGSTSNVHSDNAPTLFADIENNDFTVELWARIDDLDAYPTNTLLFEIINHPADDYRFVQITIPSTGYIQACVEISLSKTEYTKSSDYQLKESIWYHIALTWDASETEVGLYVNGVEQSGGALATFSAGSGSNNIYLGCRSDGAGYLDGALDEFRIWNDIRTQAEIRQYIYQSAPTSDASLEVYYKMDETSGTVVDNTEGTTSYDATAVNTSTYPSPAWYDTKYGLYFSGAGDEDYVSCPAGNKHNSTDVITIESMVYLSAITGGGDYPRILYRPQSSGAGVGLGDAAYALAFDGDYDPKPRFAINGHYIQPSTFDISPTYWYHIAGTYDKNAASDQMKLYVDGILVATGTCTDDIPIGTCNSCNLALGAGYNGVSTYDYFLKGYLDEVRVWESCRTAEQIRENMYLSLTGGEADLKMYWKFDQPGGTTVPDAAYIGIPVDGTQSGCTWGRCKSFYTWLDTEDDDWTNTTNWSIGDLPSYKRCISIYDFGDNTMPVLGASNIRNLVLGTGANFALSVDDELTIGINLHNFGTLTINSDATGTGSLKTSGDATNSGTINIERYIAGWSDNAHGWHFLSSPVEDYTIGSSVFEPGDNDDLFLWSESNGLWVNYKPGDEPSFTDINGNDYLNPGTGYLVAYENSATKTFTGDLNQEDIPISGLTYTAEQDYPGFHLLGNPFPCALDFGIEIYWNKSGSIGTYAQVWNESTASYKVLAGDQIIPAMNGFMVYTNASGGSLTIPAGARTISDSNWYKSTTEKSFIVLNAVDPEGNTSQKTLIDFHPDATTDFDLKQDALFIAGFAPRFYSTGSGHCFALNCLPQYSHNMEIPIGFIKNQNTSFYINLEQSLPEITVYLTDHKTNTTQNLTNNPIYTFTAEDGDDPNRFLLHFQAVGIDEPTTSGQELSIMVRNHEQTLNISNPEQLTGTVEVINMTGQTILTAQLQNAPKQTINHNLKPGLYVVQIEAKNKIKNQKILIK